MEASLRAALKAGLAREEFWPSTPYNVGMTIKEVGAARVEAALYSGWFAERFAREERLQGPQHYISEFLTSGGGSEVQEAMAEAELTRMAMAWGLELEDLGSGG